MVKRFKDFAKFCRLQLDTNDYDAHIPFLTCLSERLSLSREKSIWLGLLYMAYYTEGSMWAVFRDPGVRSRKSLPTIDPPITTQRRNLYGGRINRHLEELYEVKSFCKWFSTCETWADLLEKLSTIYGNGRWASYTTAELITHLGDLPIEPDSYDILDSSGPRKGLEFLGLQVSEESAHKILSMLCEELEQDIAVSVLESLLCDWAGMNKGTFYAGRNIDRQQGRILKVEELDLGNCAMLWSIRAQVFPSYSLGEYWGWEGIDSKRLKAYRDNRQILGPGDNR